MPFFDSDEQITEKTGRTPAEIIKSDGEAAFRKTESETIRELSAETHVIIATGGGAVTVKENALSLKSNGRIYFIDRPLDMLTVTPDRPLSSSIKALKTVYENRIDLYRGTADIIVKNDTDINTVCERIRKDFYENFSC